MPKTMMKTMFALGTRDDGRDWKMRIKNKKSKKTRKKKNIYVQLCRECQQTEGADLVLSSSGYANYCREGRRWRCRYTNYCPERERAGAALPQDKKHGRSRKGSLL